MLYYSMLIQEPPCIAASTLYCNGLPLQCIYIKYGMQNTDGKVFRIGIVRYNWPMSAHASQAFSIAHCTDSEDLPTDAEWVRCG